MREDRSGGINLNKSANSYANIPCIDNTLCANQLGGGHFQEKNQPQGLSQENVWTHLFKELDRLLH